MSNNFLGVPDNDDPHTLAEYFRPKKMEELRMQLQQPISPQAKFNPRAKEVSELMKSVGMTREEFVNLALDQPDLWTPEEMSGLLEPRQNKELIEQMAIEYFTGLRQPKKRESPMVKQTKSIRRNTIVSNMSATTIPSLSELEKTIPVDKWWLSQKTT